MKNRLDTITEQELARGAVLYSTAPATTRGSFVLSQVDALELPIDVGNMYELMDDAIQRQPAKAREFAQTFGMTSVNLALDARDTFFEFEQIGAHTSSPRFEITTRAEKRLGQILAAAEQDGSTTYLLSDSGESQTVEMSLIQAMHMVDTALVTGQYPGKRPLVQLIDVDELLDLKDRLPQLFIRPYGNVRGAENVPKLLGCVIATQTLESLNIATRSLTLPKPPSKKGFESINKPQREAAAFVGITTAKRPHIGHGFLLVKAVADTPSGTIVVELNDQGPRVEQMIAQLMINTGLGENELLQAISNGSIDVLEVERAYQERDASKRVQTSLPYKLAANNAMFRDLLEALKPAGVTFDIVANSEAADRPDLVAPNGRQALLGGTGMSVISDLNTKAMVVEAGGKKTLPGVITTYCGKYALTLVDSPSPLTKGELAILRNNQIDINRVPGTGVLIDFSIGSGTRGGLILIEDLVKRIDDPSLLLPALRVLMDRSYFFDGEGDSLLPNFASCESLNDQLEKIIVQNGLEFVDIRKPIQFTNIKALLALGLLRDAQQAFQTKKLTAGGLKSLVSVLPGLQAILSEPLIASIELLAETDTIPKTRLRPEDVALIQKIRKGDMQTIFDVSSINTEEELQIFIAGSTLESALKSMGYAPQQFAEVIKRIISARGVFKIHE